MENTRELNFEEMDKVTGGELDSVVTGALDEAIARAKSRGKTLEKFIQDFYRYNRDFTKEHEAYVRAHW